MKIGMIRRICCSAANGVSVYGSLPLQGVPISGAILMEREPSESRIALKVIKLTIFDDGARKVCADSASTPVLRARERDI
jgi:hypothetical protein